MMTLLPVQRTQRMRHLVHDAHAQLRTAALHETRHQQKSSTQHTARYHSMMQHHAIHRI
jgi:hypothetical protein